VRASSSLSMVHTRAWPRISPSTKIYFFCHFRGLFHPVVVIFYNVIEDDNHASVQRILDTINRRESPNVVSLSDCQRSARSLSFLSHRTHASLGLWVPFHSPMCVCVCVCACTCLYLSNVFACTRYHEFI